MLRYGGSIRLKVHCVRGCYPPVLVAHCENVQECAVFNTLLSVVLVQHVLVRCIFRTLFDAQRL